MVSMSSSVAALRWPPEISAVQGANGPQIPDEQFYQIVDVLQDIARETGRSVSQAALNWVLRRPTISSVVIGARNEAQLKDNLGAADFTLSPEQVKRLDEVSERPIAYPYWHQRKPLAAIRNPVPV
ncbi:MAG: aldo/keto reductase [Rhodospirillaceae bacterium]|nr:aldo/keto reductase [Rhodospirillaceae bacterium]